MDLNGAHVLVTGASRGIGEATAEALAAAGARLSLVARSRAALESLADRLGGSGHVAHDADVTDIGALQSLIARAEEAAGPLDVLVNNAGIDHAGPLMEMSALQLEDVFRTNLLAPAELCRIVLPGMVERRHGHIVNVSSLAGVAAFSGLAPYASTKAGLTQLTSVLRLELKGTGVRTTVVELGPVPTDMLDHVSNVAPTARSFGRYYRIGLLVDIPREKVASAIVDAIRRGRRHVRLPRRTLPFALMTEAPRRINEIFLTGVPSR